MSDTPRTDEFESKYNLLTVDGLNAAGDFARQLERELASSQARVAELEEYVTKLCDRLADVRKTKEARIRELEEQVKGMKCCGNCKSLIYSSGSDSVICNIGKERVDYCENWQPKEAR